MWSSWYWSNVWNIHYKKYSKKKRKQLCGEIDATLKTEKLDAYVFIENEEEAKENHQEDIVIENQERMIKQGYNENVEDIKKKLHSQNIKIFPLKQGMLKNNKINELKHEITNKKQKIKLMPIQKLQITPNKKMNINLIDNLMALDDFAFNNEIDQNESEYSEKINRINEILSSKQLTNEKYILTEDAEFQVEDDNTKIIVIANLSDLLNESEKTSVKICKYIEIIDSYVYKRTKCKFKYLNVPVFERRNPTKPEAEQTQGTILQKFKTHQYVCTTTSHQTPEALNKELHKFFEHYSDNAKHPITFVEEFKKQMQQLQSYVFKKIWNLSECKKYYVSHNTSFCETKFSTCLKFLPKRILYRRHYKTRTKLLDLYWDSNHISTEYMTKFGSECVQLRKNFKQNIILLNFK